MFTGLVGGSAFSSGQSRDMCSPLPQQKHSPACDIFVMLLLARCACAAEISMALGSETGVYTVGMSLVAF